MNIIKKIVTDDEEKSNDSTEGAEYDYLEREYMNP